MRIVELSSYCNTALFNKILQFHNINPISPANSNNDPSNPSNNPHNPTITQAMFLKYWQTHLMNQSIPVRFFKILSRHSFSTYLTREDWVTVVQEIVDRHPGLEFLEQTPKFQLRYAQTVIARIFYQVNRSGNEKMTLGEIKKSNILVMLAMLDEQDDINKINDYFSYEHFYVIYCKFWELDTDHDSLLDASDLLRYDDYALTSKVVERIIAGYARPLRSGIPGKMGYEDFVVFLISEVDKTNLTSLDYWFRCLDLDSDGAIAAYEMANFFEEQRQRMQALSQEEVLFPDIMCQLVDMVQPLDQHRFVKKDLLRTQMAPLFFNMLFNMNKYLVYEHRDPVQIKQVHATPQLTDWDRYAIAGYFALADCDPDEEQDELGEGDDDDWNRQNAFDQFDDQGNDMGFS